MTFQSLANIAFLFCRADVERPDSWPPKNDLPAINFVGTAVQTDSSSCGFWAMSLMLSVAFGPRSLSPQSLVTLPSSANSEKRREFFSVPTDDLDCRAHLMAIFHDYLDHHAEGRHAITASILVEALSTTFNKQRSRLDLLSKARNGRLVSYLGTCGRVWAILNHSFPLQSNPVGFSFPADSQHRIFSHRHI